MLRVVVLDGGRGQGSVAQYLATELKTIRVLQMVDWGDLPYERLSAEELCRRVAARLRPYIGNVDLIVLGGYGCSLALDDLRRRYPQQRFVGVDVDCRYITGSRCPSDSVALMSGGPLMETPLWRRIQRALPWSTLIVPDCADWRELIDHGELTKEILRADLQDYFVLTRNPLETRRKLKPSIPQFDDRETPDDVCSANRTLPLREQIIRFLGQTYPTRPQLAFAAADYDEPIAANRFAAEVSQKRGEENGGNGGDENDGSGAGEVVVRRERRELLRPDVVVLVDTSFWAIKTELQELFGIGVRVIDFRQQLLHEVCLALGLRGIDGRLDCRYS